MECSFNYCPDGGNGNFHCSSSFLTFIYIYAFSRLITELLFYRRQIFVPRAALLNKCYSICVKVPDMTSTWQLRSNRSQGLPDRLKKRPSRRATMSRDDLPEPINLSIIDKQTRNYSYILPTQQTCRKMCITSSNSISHSSSACCWREPQTNELRKCAKTFTFYKMSTGEN